MRKGIPARIRNARWITVVFISLVLGFIMTLGIQFFKTHPTSQPSTEQQSHVALKDTPPAPESINQISQPLRAENSSPDNRFFAKKKQASEIEQLVVGTVLIINSDLGTVARFPAAVISGSWLALPSRVCIGGDKWFFRVGNDKAIPIEGGLWGRGDNVGFWQLAGEKEFQGPDFSTWQQETPVRLLSIESGQLSEPMILAPSGMQGAFIYSSLAEPLESGVFLQNGKVVGWSFGELQNGAYMWTLGQNTNILYENYVDDFYNETFAGGREEYFFKALSMGKDSSPQSQLQMFAEGFWTSPKLSSQNAPRYLSAEAVYPYISELVQNIMDQEAYQYITALTEEPLLREIRSPELLNNVVLATQKIYGTERAVDFIEGTGAEIQRAIEGKTIELTRFHLELYLEWIKILLDNGDIAKGWQVHTRAQPQFNESPELQLLAVELALAGNNWAEAENLLYQREYPATLRETRMLLAERISDQKGQANKIVIRFQAGSRTIPVKATLNDDIDHDFLVDTGASFVTIPYATVKALGLEDEMSQHLLEVQTAGGTVKARAVTLSSIELQGWVVPNIKALVIDLPSQPGLGLLGLNFLNSFGMDLQADKGILILEPK